MSRVDPDIVIIFIILLVTLIIVVSKNKDVLSTWSTAFVGNILLSSKTTPSSQHSYNTTPLSSANTNSSLAGTVSSYKGGNNIDVYDEFDILESAPLNRPEVEIFYRGGGDSDGAELSHQKDSLVNTYAKFRTHGPGKIDENMSYGDVSTADVIIGIHFANWCIYCNDLKSKWPDVIKGVNKLNASGNKKYAIVGINEENNRHKKITTVPTILMYKRGGGDGAALPRKDGDRISKGDGDELIQYNGKSKPKKIIKWISN